MVILPYGPRADGYGGDDGMAETIELTPISEDAFCGPDLDMEGDLEFMNFSAAIEGQLPASFFSFDRASIDFRTALATAAEFKKRTYDLRLMLLSAKLSILNRDFYAFAREVAEVVWLLQHHWDEVHPQADGGRFDARLAQLQSLNDNPIVVLPMQYATLLQTDREGALNFRAVMITTGDAKPREGEKLASAGVIERMLTSTVEVEALARLYATLTQLREDLNTLYTLTAERVDYENAVKLDALEPLVGKMLDWAQAALARRDPSMAPAPENAEGGGEAQGDEAASAGPGTFETIADVDAALAAALGYFLTREPSSPALLFIAQARACLGKNLYEVIRLLTPRHADSARVFVGPGDAFAIPISNLQNAPALDFSPSEAEPAATRGQAFGLMEKVSAHLRVAEPSSPTPYLLDRARSLASRDFLSLLGEVYGPDEIQYMKNGR